MKLTFPIGLLATSILLCLLAALSACGGAAETSLHASDAEAPAAGRAALPSIPAGRTPTALTETSRTGIQTFARSTSAAEVDPALLLSAAPGAVSWAIWELPADDELRYLDLSLAVPAGQEAYIAVADYQRLAWEIQGPVTTGRVLTLDPLKHSSPGGNMYAAVLVDGGNSVTVSLLSLIAFHSNAAPSAALDASLTSGNAPLSVSFDASASSDPDPGDSVVLYHWDFDGDGVFDGSGTTPNVSHTYTLGGSFNAEVTVEDRDGERASENVSIAVNGAPTARLEVAPPEVKRGELVTLNAGGSTEPDGDALTYEFDTDGDGNYDLDAGSNPNVSIGSTQGGNYTLRVRVTDAGGASAEATAGLYVHGFYTLAAAPTATTLQSDTDCALLNGNPAIIFADNDSGDLKFARGLDSSGKEWDSVVTADPGNEAVDVSMAIINGHPAASYFDASAEELRYVRASDPLGAAWDPEIIVDTVNRTGKQSSLADVSGRPAISYFDDEARDLRYVRANDADGDSWPTPKTLDSAGETGLYTTLLMVAGRPAISYKDETVDNLRFVRAQDANGDLWNAGINVDASANDVGSFATMQLISGRPAIAYINATTDQLLFVRSGSDTGSFWPAPSVVGPANDAVQNMNLEEVQGFPAICYLRGAAGLGLNYVRAKDGAGALWESPVLVDDDLTAGGGCAMLVADGRALISYNSISEDGGLIQVGLGF